jgi:D-serine deaminase-like pyridoxal phosphate-dependent protein
LGVAVAIRGRGDSIGASPDEAPDLAYRIQDKAPNLRFAGLFEAPSGTLGLDSAATTDERLDALSDAEFKCTSQCIPPPMVAAGGSADYDEVAARDDVTEILAGSYALMEGALIAARPELTPAAKILTTVMSHQDHGLVWLDAGQKATSIDTGMPEVEGVPGASVPRMSAEHGGMVLEEGATWDVDLGTKVWLVPHSITNTVNVYDFIHAIRDGRLDAVWEVAARGRYQ